LASIILYSLGSIANGFVHTVDQYAIVRFITGLGLAGELGAGITLVSELMPKEKRGIATSLVAGIGLSGAVFAYFIKVQFGASPEGWRTCYLLAGGLVSYCYCSVSECSNPVCIRLLRRVMSKEGIFSCCSPVAPA